MMNTNLQQFKHSIANNLWNNSCQRSNQSNIQEFITSLQKIHELQNQNQLQNLILLLRNIAQICSKSLTFKSQSIAKNGQQNRIACHQTIQNKLIDVKNRHQRLLIRLLNLRAKMIRQMYMHKTPLQTHETDLSLLNEQIRHRKMQITTKCNQLRFMKSNDHERNVEINKEKLVGFNLPLKQFKSGTQLLQKQTLKIKQQLNLLIAYTRSVSLDNL